MEGSHCDKDEEGHENLGVDRVSLLVRKIRQLFSGDLGRLVQREEHLVGQLAPMQNLQELMGTLGDKSCR